MRPEEFIRTAEELLARTNRTEADERSAVSRAYYALLLACRDSLPAEHAPIVAGVRSSHSHRDILDSLGLWATRRGSGREDARIVAKLFPSMKLHRELADYEIHNKLNQQVIGACVGEATRLSALIRVAREKYDASAGAVRR